MTKRLEEMLGFLYGLSFLIVTLGMIVFASIAGAFIFMSILTFLKGETDLLINTVYDLNQSKNNETVVGYFFGVLTAFMFVIVIKMGEHYKVIVDEDAV